MDRRAALATAARHRRRSDRRAPGAPKDVRLTVVAGKLVGLSWKAAHDDRRVTGYRVLRDGKRVGSGRRLSFTDRRVRPGHTYTYTVRAFDAAGNLSKPSKPLKVTTPGGSIPGTGTPPAPTGSTNPAGAAAGVSGGATISGGSSPAISGAPLSRAMVDRMFWRAGFGPSDADRQVWTGRGVLDLVDWLLETANALRSTSTPPKTQTNAPIDPVVSDDEFVMDWIDRMQRSVNPLVERLTFFLHRHWAVSRISGEVPYAWMLNYAARLRSYADLASNPDASFRDLALDMTTKDAAMSLFLNGNQNVKGHPNENYAREFMELFCLGVKDASGAPNYSQTDVQELARAFTGWKVNQDPASPSYGVVSFTASSFDAGTKTILGSTAAHTAASAVGVVLAHPNHAPYFVTKLWHEFIVAAPDPATLDDLVSTYTAGGALRFKPLLRKILSHPSLFESLDEPNMIKPPVVFAVGVHRALDAPLKGYWTPQALDGMQQKPYFPPNVAGWEGGLSWLNTSTAQARFDLLVRLLWVKYGTGSSAYPGGQAIPDAGAAESASAAFDRALAEVGSPWMSAQTEAQIRGYAAAAPAGTAIQRQQRQYSLRALMLGGPDGQVM